MNPIYTGKDVSFIDTKQAQRLAENTLIAAEKFATSRRLLGARFPTEAIDKAWRQLLFGAHHDGITGSESDQVYLDLLGGWREAVELGRGALDGRSRLPRQRDRHGRRRRRGDRLQPAFVAADRYRPGRDRRALRIRRVRAPRRRRRQRVPFVLETIERAGDGSLGAGDRGVPWPRTCRARLPHVPGDPRVRHARGLDMARGRRGGPWPTTRGRSRSTRRGVGRSRAWWTGGRANELLRPGETGNELAATASTPCTPLRGGAMAPRAGRHSLVGDGVSGEVNAGESRARTQDPGGRHVPGVPQRPRRSPSGTAWTASTSRPAGRLHRAGPPVPGPVRGGRRWRRGPCPRSATPSWAAVSGFPTRTLRRLVHAGQPRVQLVRPWGNGEGRARRLGQRRRSARVAGDQHRGGRGPGHRRPGCGRSRARRRAGPAGRHGDPLPPRPQPVRLAGHRLQHARRQGLDRSPGGEPLHGGRACGPPVPRTPQSWTPALEPRLGPHLGSGAKPLAEPGARCGPAWIRRPPVPHRGGPDADAISAIDGLVEDLGDAVITVEQPAELDGPTGAVEDHTVAILNRGIPSSTSNSTGACTSR